MSLVKCKKCNQEITGYSEAQVNSRMNMHMRSHKSADLSTRGENNE